MGIALLPAISPSLSMVSPIKEDGVETLSELKNHISLQISTSRKGLLSNQKSPKDFPENVSISAPTIGKTLKKRFNTRIFKEIDWNSMCRMCKKWVRKPLNMALSLWLACVIISGAILFLVMTGMLNSALPKKSQRDIWFEVNNQIISALFTLMCLYQHPNRLYHLVLLCRWSPEDVSQLRTVYSKKGSYKPNERFHMVIVIVLLHINCFAQYGLCGLNLGFRRANRPPIGVGICLSLAIASPAIAGLYTILSPLGKDYESDPILTRSLQKKFTFATRDELVFLENKPVWSGGLFSLWEDFSVAYLSLFCCFCVFGWNMERLGFGNMYVHIVTFVLFCSGPFWIFNLAAVNIDNEIAREILGIFGIALSMFGLLYGGFWRIQMRKRYNLPSNKYCGGKSDIADCFQWLFCCWCSLAQEVRTGDFYEILENGERDSHTPLAPLPREDWKKPSNTMDETVTDPPVSARISK